VSQVLVDRTELLVVRPSNGMPGHLFAQRTTEGIDAKCAWWRWIPHGSIALQDPGRVFSAPQPSASLDGAGGCYQHPGRDQGAQEAPKWPRAVCHSSHGALLLWACANASPASVVHLPISMHRHVLGAPRLWAAVGWRPLP